MKIAFLIDGFGVGGTELNATRTLEAFARRGVQVDVIHLHADGPLRSRIAATGHRLIHVPIVPLSSPRIATRILALRSALSACGATVIHTQDVYTNILGVAAGRVLLRRAVLTSRRWKDDVPRKALTPLNAWAHRHSTLVLPNSPSLVTTLRAEGVPADRIAVHENFVDDAALLPLDESAQRAWRAALAIPRTAPIIGCVARLSRVKRHDVLLAAFSTVLTRVPEAYLLLVGDGDARAALESQARDLRIAHRIVFAGTLPNTPLPQQLFDVAVLTSENEGFPNSLVEASAMRVPLVATAVGGVTDILIEGVTGLSVPVADPVQTAAAIVTLLDDRNARERMGNAGHALIRERYTETAAIDRLLALYRRVSR